MAFDKKNTNAYSRLLRIKRGFKMSIPLRLAHVGLGLTLFFQYSPPGFGYVLLSARKATLPITQASPNLNFVWDGQSPEIKEKEKFAGGIYANLDDDAFMEQLLTFSLNAWNEVPGAFVNLTFQKSNDPSSVTLDSDDGQFSIITDSSTNLSTAAFAKPFVDPEDPETIMDCDISIADHSTTAQSLAYTIIHELGHCLGLGHSHTNYNAIMGYARTPSGNLKLGADDIAGLVFLYPDSNYVSDNPKNLVCGSIAPETTWRNRSSKNWWLALLFLAPLGIIFKNRFRKTSSF